MIPVQYSEINVPKWPYLFAILFALVCLYSISKQNQLSKTDYIALAISVVLICWAILSIKRNKIIIDNDGFTHRKILKDTLIQWHEIKSVDIVMEGGHAGITFVWKFESWNKKDYRMYFSYGRKKLQFLAQALVSKCDTVYISSRVKKFAVNKNYSFFLNK